MISSVFSLLLVVTCVYAHGFVTSVVIDGRTYPGSNGAKGSSNSPVRKVSSASPVMDIRSQDMVCGLDAQLALTTASAKPGSSLQFFWQADTGAPWFHNTGPIQTFMTTCVGDCSSFTPSASTEWFKISELGEKEPGTPNTWVQGDILHGAPVNITLPNNIAAGNYLMRHEIISLQRSQITGDAEFYPSCLQLKVSGGGNGVPDKTVKFPGAYSASDPGILGNFYNPGIIYEFPGGPVSNLRDAFSDGDDVNPNASAPGTASSTGPSVTSPTVPANVAPTPVIPTTTQTVTGSCKRKPKSKRSVLRSAYTSVKQQGLSAHRKRRFQTHFL